MKRKNTDSKEEIGLMVLCIVKLGFKDLSITKKTSLSDKIVRKMTDNSYFLNPMPTLASVSTAISELRQAQAKLPGSKELTIIRNQKEKALNKKMAQLQAYVEAVADGNPEIVLSSGMNLRDQRSPIGYLPFTEWIKGKDGAEDGSYELRWKVVKKASGYRIEITDELVKGWKRVLITKKASITVRKLKPGVRYNLRIATLSSKGFDGYRTGYAFRPKLPLY
ncbi:MAG: fibronectin type III domain-containing protein [Bacteroidetes bacterium]|nr:fibronectin type III domain-containing protein [Bacteroidota bacterium]